MLYFVVEYTIAATYNRFTNHKLRNLWYGTDNPVSFTTPYVPTTYMYYMTTLVYNITAASILCYLLIIT